MPRLRKEIKDKLLTTVNEALALHGDMFLFSDGEYNYSLSRLKILMSDDKYDCPVDYHNPMTFAKNEE